MTRGPAGFHTRPVGSEPSSTMPSVPEPTTTAGDSAAHSRLYQRLHRRYGAEWPLLAPGLPDRAAMAAACDSWSSSA